MKRQFSSETQPDIVPVARSTCETVGAEELLALIGFVQEQNGRDREAAGPGIVPVPFREPASKQALDQSTQRNGDEDADKNFKSAAGVGR